LGSRPIEISYSMSAISQLKDKRILLTRAVPQAQSFANQLKERGAFPIIIPTIQISDPPDWGPFDKALAMLSEFHWLLFTSVNAVEKTAKRLKEADLKLSDYPLLKIAVVGSKTAEVVQKEGWKVSLLPKQYQAEGLLYELEKQGVSHKKIWFPRALRGRDILHEGLTRLGGTVVMTAAYENTVPIENESKLLSTLAHENLDWLVFTSPSTIANFFTLISNQIPLEDLPKIASIGAVTTKALLRYGIDPKVSANPQNVDGLLIGMERWELENR